MHNKEINNIIDNLKGRRKYEEKKATKLGFNSLHDYFADKLFQQKKAIEEKKRQLELTQKQNKFVKKENTKKKSCGCC